MIRLYSKKSDPPFDNELAEIPIKLLIFPGGEPHCEVPVDLVQDQTLLIDARIGTMNEFMQVLVLVDALYRARAGEMSLLIPYFPGARQDRVTSPGTALTVGVLAGLINAQPFKNVFVLDPHSDVTPALLCPHAVVLPPERVLREVQARNNPDDFCGGYAGVISPDVGAEKRAQVAADFLDIPLFHGRKHRDPATGKLSGFSVDSLDWPHHTSLSRTFLVVDDICDGGGTFVGLAEQVPSAVKLHLFVTHGIFSKGFGKLNQRFDRVISTDSFPSLTAGGNKLQATIPIFPLYRNFILERM